jgi:lysophospholipase L1-like esterase
MRPLALLLFCLGLAALPAAAARDFAWRDGERVLLLGDSITAAGGYAQYLETYLRTRFPERRIEILNLGLPSETVSGQSEPDHPYPRPNVHERLDRALARVRPSVVVACYGMNDGIYYPFGEERFAAYQAGIRALLAKVRAAGARPLLLTPSAFDALPVARMVKGDGEAKYSWMAPYRDYDAVLGRYSRWLLTLRSRDLPVGDAHAAVSRHLAAMRRTDPAYHTARDGVHPNAAGQWLLTGALLDLLDAPAEVDRADVDAAGLRVRAGAVADLARDGRGVRFTWRTRLPLPLDPAWPPAFAETERLGERFNRHPLRVRGLPRGAYRILEGDLEAGRATAAELAAGIDASRFPKLSIHARALEVLRRVQRRERLLAAAWLTAVGHKRPDTPVGLPLDQAETQAAVIETELRALASPAELRLRVLPVD